MQILTKLFIAISIALAAPNISALTAPQRYSLQKTSPRSPGAFTSGIEGLLPKEDIKTFRLLNRLPKEIKSGELFKHHFTTQELLKLYDDLLAIKKNINETTGSNIYDVSDLLDNQGNFKGNNILHAIQDAAGRKLAKKINCTFDSIEDGSCQPLINSTYQNIWPEDRTRKPFQEITEPWTKNWIKLLSEYEKFENTLPSDKRTLLPVTFLRHILNTQLDQKLPNAFRQAVTETAQQEGFKISMPTVKNENGKIEINYNNGLSLEQYSKEPFISLYKSVLPDTDIVYDAQISVAKNHKITYLLGFDDFPKKISISGGSLYMSDYPEVVEIIFTIAKKFAKAMGALSLEIWVPLSSLSDENRTFYEQLGFRENAHGKLALDLQPEVNT